MMIMMIRCARAHDRAGPCWSVSHSDANRVFANPALGAVDSCRFWCDGLHRLSGGGGGRSNSRTQHAEPATGQHIYDLRWWCRAVAGPGSPSRSRVSGTHTRHGRARRPRRERRRQRWGAGRVYRVCLMVPVYGNRTVFVLVVYRNRLYDSASVVARLTAPES
jgi:hypothetical protein